ncbi:hypothetical protein F5883DRAFT_232412 [Diaporthe sp. PMI_573]|nr:hypothetical protein F5883DRAFT_232412 [Diaporthaceae sp. PMI_573]
MIPMPGRAETNTPATRRQFSSTIASRAHDYFIFESQSKLESSALVRTPAHPLVPFEVESILALCLLGQYEYLQHGSMEKMQRLTREALESAMQLRLHLHQSSNTYTIDDVRQRAWWTVYLCACNVTIVSCVPPIMPLKDPNSIYPTPYPQSGNWKVHVKAERLLVLATLFLVNLIREFGNPIEMEPIRKSMQALDAEICHSLAEIDAPGSPCPSSFHMKVALIRLHSARIKVHRYCALLDDDSASLDTISDARLGVSAPAVPVSSDTVSPTPSMSTLDPLPPSSTSGRHFPFSSAHSMRYCLESARVILQILPDLATVQMPGTDSKFYTFTPFACPIVLAGYTFLMLGHKVGTRRSPMGPEPGNRDLPGECERGAESCMEVLDGFSRAWMHLGDAAMHMKEAARCL